MAKSLVKSLFLTALVIVAGCSFAETKTITDTQFVLLYVDLSFAAEQFLSDSVHLSEIQDSIFNAHKVSRDQFDNYKTELDKSPERWSKIWQMVAEELEKREEQLKRTKSDPVDRPKD